MKVCQNKTCRHNRTPQPATNFYKKPCTADGLVEECMDCRKERRTIHAAKQKENYNNFFLFGNPYILQLIHLPYMAFYKN